MPVTVIKSVETLRNKMADVWKTVSTLVQAGHAVEIDVREAKKSRLMEKKYHAMFRDVAQQVEVEGRKYDAGVWKRLLVDQFEQELMSQGQQLKQSSRTVISLDGKRAVTLSASTAQFRKSEAGDFIAFLYAWGAEFNVAWSDDYMRFYEEYKARW